MSISSETSLDTDARRLALEVIATLVNVKTTTADQLLRPAGVKDDLIRRFLGERDPITGQKRSKREAGTVLLEALSRIEDGGSVVRELIAIASRWNAFHLARDEYQARAVFQKARELSGTLAAADTRERVTQEQRARAEAELHRKEKQAARKQQSELLLAQFDHASIADDLQRRGYLLEDLLNRVFDLHDFPVTRAFLRNDRGAEDYGF